MNQSRENLRADRRMDGQTQQPQVTGDNTQNHALKRMLRYFLKIPLLKKILQF